jgi:hyperosmotically inducible protein
MSKINSLWVCAVAALIVTLSACAETPTQRSAGQVVDDVTLTGRVKTALIGNHDTKARDISVEVYKGDVQLNGFVDSKAEKAEAGKVAAQVDGVKYVHNNLQVQMVSRSGGEVIDDAVITAKVKAALIADKRTKAYEIEVTTDKGKVQLGGFVDTSTAKAAATDIAAAVTGVKAVSNVLETKS